ncbi:MAG: hypothetical protein FH749_09655 [Firmicutes bacterium]|nr:hypothetical protein [Bacillota bacterium]
MLTVNFRREPIYLSHQKLTEERYKKYQLAVRKIPELASLRDRFIGRVFHRNPEQWQQDVLALLRFNINAGSDDEQWLKGWEEESPL